MFFVFMWWVISQIIDTYNKNTSGTYLFRPDVTLSIEGSQVGSTRVLVSAFKLVPHYLPGGINPFDIPVGGLEILELMTRM
jgi:hypothetical protein